MASRVPAKKSAAPTRRDQAVARVLDPARTRAEVRVERFLDAARELMSAKGNDFTVQDVVERSGQSLRGFYQHFDGKYELLLALFEDSVAASAVEVGRYVDEEATPLDRLHRFVVEYFRLCRPPTSRARRSRKTPPALAEFAQQLLNEHPAEAGRAFRPLVDILDGLLDEAARDGAIREHPRRRRIAGFVLQSIMFNAYISTINASGSRATDLTDAEDMWTLLFAGLRPAG
jgi:AcrR family transcriptional regulator